MKQYTIKPGDTYWGIANSYGGGGTNYSSLVSLNPGVNYRTLQVGSKINVPDSWNVPGSSQPSSNQSNNPVVPQTNNNNNNNNSSNPIPDMIKQEQTQSNQVQQQGQDTINKLQSQYGDIVNLLKSFIPTIQGDTATQISNLKDQATTGTQQMQEAGKYQEDIQNANANAAGANAADAYGGRGFTGVNPFVESAKQAAATPYAEQATQIAQQTQLQIAQFVAQITGQEDALQTASDQQIQQIATEVAQIAPQETQAIAQINNNIAQIVMQYQNNEISQEQAQQQLQEQQREWDQQYAQMQAQLQEQIRNDTLQYQVGEAQASAAQTQANTAAQAEKFRETQEATPVQVAGGVQFFNAAGQPVSGVFSNSVAGAGLLSIVNAVKSGTGIGGALDNFANQLNGQSLTEDQVKQTAQQQGLSVSQANQLVQYLQQKKLLSGAAYSFTNY